MLLLPGVGLACLLAVVAQTAGGRLVGVACVLLPLAGLLFLVERRRGALASVVLGLGCLGGAWWQTPSADAVQATGLSVFLGSTQHRRIALTQMVPEVDQFTLGAHLIPALDPFIDGPQSTRIRQLFEGVYAELRADPAFAQAGSVMGDAYAELWGGGWRNDHLFRYPAPSGGAPRPVLLFLHGSAGNFLGYLWVLKAFADRAGWAVVAPDFGFGNWHRHPIAPTLERVLAYIDAQPDLDGDRVMLAGLSNGGRGVVRVARGWPERFRAAVLFSPVIDQTDDLPDLPWFVLHARSDRRIPVLHVANAVHRMRAAGLTVDLRLIEGDHFIFFSRRDAVIDVLERARAAMER